MQLLTIAGNVGKDAELRTTQGGDSVLAFSLAVDNGKDGQGNKRPATWFDCSIWGKRAQSLDGYIRKGTKLVVSGRPTARAHNEKAYLGISVDSLTFMGGGDRREEGRDDPSRSYSGAHGSGSGMPSGGTYDDEIPFMPERRI